MLKIVVCDDIRVFGEKVVKEAKELLNALDVQADVEYYSNGIDLLSDIESLGYVDILILDIEMDEINGLDVAKRIRELQYTTILIFMSSHNKYYKAAFDVQPFQFIDKPINKKEFNDILEKAIKICFKNTDAYYEFKSNRKYYKISIFDIMYISSDKRQLTIVCDKEEINNIYGKLDDVEIAIGDRGDRFIRIHQSYLVNTRYIYCYKRDSITLSNGEELSISVDRRKLVRDIYTSILEEK